MCLVSVCACYQRVRCYRLSAARGAECDALCAGADESPRSHYNLCLAIVLKAELRLRCVELTCTPPPPLHPLATQCARAGSHAKALTRLTMDPPSGADPVYINRLQGSTSVELPCSRSLQIKQSPCGVVSTQRKVVITIISRYRERVNVVPGHRGRDGLVLVVVARWGRGGRASRGGDTQRALDEFEELAGLRAGAGAYTLEHLATFTVTRETGIVYPADGMRRLLQLEKTNGIWSQKMQLCLDGQWVLVMDYETGVSVPQH
ncbi:hypothetical protein MSG28_011328 [Choristoneura fumiferana]|uniref:Uncharacterized protein n=1 Tax=Choristoneura fumiferana TaxID=7141 RepID=A0ACC0JMY0_CHOFU|nr:hypothetical protein MSG28_011328 [Choristoneura fumiferana]